VIWFLHEQMRSMTQSVYGHSYDFLVLPLVFLQHCTKCLQVFAQNCEKHNISHQQVIENEPDFCSAAQTQTRA